MGRSSGAALTRPLIELEDGRADGAISPDGQVLGTYVHGLFEEPDACRALLAWAGLAAPIPLDHRERRERALDTLADAVESSLRLRQLLLGIEPAAAARSAPERATAR
jgi:adenosylcobyric acid synthase